MFVGLIMVQLFFLIVSEFTFKFSYFSCTNFWLYNVVLIIWFDFFVQKLSGSNHYLKVTKCYLILIGSFYWFHNKRVDKRVDDMHDVEQN